MNQENDIQSTHAEIFEDIRDIRLTVLIDMLREKEILTDDEILKLNL